MEEARTVDADEDARFRPGKRGDELPVELANRQRRADAMFGPRHAAAAAERPAISIS